MPTTTHTLLASSVLDGNAPSITFSSISAAYRDLILVMRINPTADYYPRLRFNGDTGTSYSYVEMIGDGSNTASYFSNGENGFQLNGAFPQANNPAFYIVELFDYSATDKHKVGVCRSNRTNDKVGAMVGRWNSTSAINSIQIYANNNSMTTGTTLYLYGIVG